MDLEQRPGRPFWTGVRRCALQDPGAWFGAGGRASAASLRFHDASVRDELAADFAPGFAGLTRLSCGDLGSVSVADVPFPAVETLIGNDQCTGSPRRLFGESIGEFPIRKCLLASTSSVVVLTEPVDHAALPG